MIMIENRKSVRLYVDLDGTAAKWDSTASLEQITSRGYFANVPAVITVCRAVNSLAADRAEVYVLSHVFNDDHSEQEKNQWCDWNLNNIPESHRIFVPYGKSKSDYVMEHYAKENTMDVLLDDFSANLHEWHGVGIKMYNGINGTKGTWAGYSVHARTCSEFLKNQLLGILESVRAM